MDKKFKLLISMITKGLLGFLLLGGLLFGCAGSLSYKRAWLFIIALLVLMLIMGMVLLLKYPDTLERRMKSREKEQAQRGSVTYIGLCFLLSFTLAGLDFHFGWTKLPFVLSAAALLIMISGYVVYSAVILQNAYASRVVEVEQGQKLISTRLYAVVRHPMYLATLLVFLPIPLILGSYITLIPMLAFPAGLVLRIKNEETVLMKGLEGYEKYMKQTKYRLLPFIW